MNRRKTLTVLWQRLVSEGETCPRCGSTEDEIDKGVTLLRQSLDPLGVEIILEKRELSVEQFRQDTLQSNSIRINGRLLEEWLDAGTGQSECCDVCGPNDCRTMEVGGDVLEVIPADLIVKAGLLAAAELIGNRGGGSGSANDQPLCGCCS